MNRLLALIKLRFRIAFRQFSGGAKWINRLVALLLTALGVVVSLGMAFGFGFLLYHARTADDPGLLGNAWQVALWSCAFFGLFLPLLRGGTGSGIQPEQLLLYPLSRLKLFTFSLATEFAGGAHWFYYPTLAAAGVVMLVPFGPGSVAGLVLLALFVAVLVVWGHALGLVVRVLMANRRVKELIVIGAMILLILTCLLPAAIEQFRGDATSREVLTGASGFLAPVASAMSVLPPALASRGLAGVDNGDRGLMVMPILWLAVWAFAGLVLGHQLFLRESGSARGARPKTGRRKEDRGGLDALTATVAGKWLSFLPPETRAVAVKDFRYLSRSVLGRFSLLMAPVLVLMFVFIFSEVFRRPLPGLRQEGVLFYSMLLYLAFLSNNFFNNTFSWEGNGAQLYFLCPVNLRHVLLGKNLAVWVFNGVLFVLAVLTWSVASELPSLASLFTGLLVFATPLVVMPIGGNLVSICYPVSRDPSAFMASPSPLGMLAGILSLVFSVLSCAAVLILPTLFGLAAWRLLFLALLLALLILVHQFLLGRTAETWSGRGERFLQAVRKSS